MVEATKGSTPGFLLCNNDTLRKAMRNLGQLYDAAMAPAGLRGSQFSVLMHIKELDEPTMKALATDLVMDLSALGHTLKPLIRDGLVRLVPNPADGRSKRVTLTTAGQRKVAEAAELWQGAQGRFEAAFGAEQARALREVLLNLSSEAFTRRFKTPGG
jgi:DNA-binding MarR family transcriptional regulator